MFLNLSLHGEKCVLFSKHISCNSTVVDMTGDISGIIFNMTKNNDRVAHSADTDPQINRKDVVGSI
jgi:GTP-sensing pleiotropic transcriptional regulator CodY